MDNVSSTSIPCKGDRRFAMFMKTLAARKSTSVAILVRQALELAYGEELQSIETFFADQDRADNPDTVRNSPAKDWDWAKSTTPESASIGKAKSG